MQQETTLKPHSSRWALTILAGTENTVQRLVPGRWNSGKFPREGPGSGYKVSWGVGLNHKPKEMWIGYPQSHRREEDPNVFGTSKVIIAHTCCWFFLIGSPPLWGGYLASYIEENLRLRTISLWVEHNKNLPSLRFAKILLYSSICCNIYSAHFLHSHMEDLERLDDALEAALVTVTNIIFKENFLVQVALPVPLEGFEIRMAKRIALLVYISSHHSVQEHVDSIWNNIPFPESNDLSAVNRECGSGSLVLAKRRDVGKQKSWSEPRPI